MKYDILHNFRVWMSNEQQLSANTQKQYYNFVKKVLRNLNWNTVEEIDSDAVATELAKLKTANDVSAARNGLLLFSQCFPTFRVEPPTAGDLHKRNRAKRKWQPLYIDAVKRKINATSNVGDRLAYRLMLATGMRVSEVADLRPGDIKVVPVGSTESDGQRLLIELRHTKKGCSDIVITDDPYLMERLPIYIQDKPPDRAIFAARSTLKNKAGHYGFECHDLRRAYAKEEFAAARQELDRDDALEVVREKMRHEGGRTTERYLRRTIRLNRGGRAGDKCLP